MQELITTFLDGKTLTDFYTILRKNWFNCLVDFSTIIVGLVAIFAIYQNQKFYQGNTKKQELIAFQEMFNFLFQQYQSISTLNEDTQKAFYQKIWQVIRNGNTPNSTNLNTDDELKRHRNQIYNILSLIDTQKSELLTDEQKSEYARLLYSIIPNEVLWLMAIYALQTHQGNYKPNNFKEMLEKYHFLETLSLFNDPASEDVIPTPDGKIHYEIKHLVPFITLGRLFKRNFSHSIWGKSTFPFRIYEIWGLAEFRQGNYQIALKILKSLAHNGSSLAQCTIAIMYSYDGYLGNNTEKSLPYYQKAAEQGNRVAQHNLATIYLKRNELEQAIYWYEQASKQNDPRSQYDLACLYANANYGINNFKRAKKWAEKACKQKEQGACELLEQINQILSQH